MKTGKGLRILLWLLVLAIFAFSAYKVLSHLLERDASRRYQEDLIDEVVTVVTPVPDAEADPVWFALPASEPEATMEPAQAYDAGAASASVPANGAVQPDPGEPAQAAHAGANPANAPGPGEPANGAVQPDPGEPAQAAHAGANPANAPGPGEPANGAVQPDPGEPAQAAHAGANPANAPEPGVPANGAVQPDPANAPEPAETGRGTIVIIGTPVPEATPAPAATPVPTETPPISVDFDRLEEKFGGVVVAWIYCPETPINYVVVQGEDNEYFLRSLPDGSYSYSGTIFMDFNNHGDFSDWNTILYGHNMKNGSMFGYVPRFYNQEFFEKHPYMYVLTPERDFKMEIFAGYVTTPESDAYLIAQTQQELDDVVAFALESSSITSDVEIRPGDRIVTLSTCTYAFEDARYVLLGVLRDLAPHAE